MVTCSKARILRKRSVGQSKWTTGFIEPTTDVEALKHASWKQAMMDELLVLQNNQTWTLVPSCPGMNIVGNRWVLKAKMNSDGSFQRYKARLVAKGFNQRPDVHFVRDKVLKKLLDIRYVASHDQIADCFTKGFTHSRFQFIVDKLGVVENSLSLRGTVKK
ncbi:uncharacterized mitochondrial protein AtMg00820-like [Humulus lupulus]|uniref:uncharacterized mitochondrial protein AtMg00820-like n=1 Tax=Humulus lupulus TaxID=3486 RepID=UPI002B4070AE|nr:uncharacterized mitochondrial protein AtMg00820-like [Humulus lupulus]